MKTYLAALQNAVGVEVSCLPKASIFGIEKEDEVAKTKESKEDADGLHGLPTKATNGGEKKTLISTWSKKAFEVEKMSRNFLQNIHRNKLCWMVNLLS